MISNYTVKHLPLRHVVNDVVFSFSELCLWVTDTVLLELEWFYNVHVISYDGSSGVTRVRYAREILGIPMDMHL